MSKKNHIVILWVLSGLMLVVAGIAYKCKHEIKDVGLRVAVKVKHQLLGGPEAPTRFKAVVPLVAQDDAVVFAASSLDRIFQDGKTLLKPSFSPTASISLAKNEYESFQVVVQSQGKDLNAVELKISDLVNSASGTKLDPNNVSWRVVGYVQTIEPYYPVKYVGLWPDPLLPGQPVVVKANMTQPFWVTVYAPAETAAGDYQGTVTVLSEGQILKTIPVTVHVYNFVLSKESHLKTAFDFYGHITKDRYPRGDMEREDAYKARINEINDKFIIEMLKYRMDPILNIDPRSQQELANIDRYMVYGLNNFAIGKMGGSFNNNWPYDSTAIENLFSLYRTYGEDLKLNDMLQYTYIYTWDEGDMGNPQVPKIASMVHRAYPGLRNMVTYHGIWDPADGPDWVKDIDIWTFQIDDFNEEKMHKLQALGKEMWMYVSGPSGASTPNLVMDLDSIDYRIIPWLCWKYDIKGFLYWCVNWWTLVDPFESAKNSQWQQNGNGLLFYPGKDGPLASVRTEIFRDGMEDYEYIQTLFNDLRILKTKGLDKKYQDYFNQSIKILTVDASIASSMSDFTKDNQVLIERRNAIARQIEAFNSLPGV